MLCGVVLFIPAPYCSAFIFHLSLSLSLSIEEKEEEEEEEEEEEQVIVVYTSLYSDSFTTTIEKKRD